MRTHLQCALVALLVAGSLVLVDAISGGETRKTETRKTLLPKVVAIPGRSYKMGKTEVTQQQWVSVMGTNPSHYSEDMTRPVENVSLEDVEEFIKRLNDSVDAQKAKVRFRLPTREEWEHACRADGAGRPLDAMGWYSDNSGWQTHPVARKKPNAWGLYDMLGNVEEWVPSSGEHCPAVKGGSFDSRAEDCSASEISSRYDESYRSRRVGFRLVSEAVPNVVSMIEVVDVPKRSYKLGKTEVTQLQWASVMGRNPSHFKGMTRPVEYVSLRDVEKFLERLNDNPWAREAKVRFRLPTKEEWEYACCAGGKMRLRLPDKMSFRMPDKRAEDYHVCRDGDESECLECLLESTCWSFWHGGKGPHPVAQKKPNAWGLYDMLGNVAELTTSTGSLESFEIMGGSFEKGDPPVVEDPDDYNAAASSGFNRSVVYRPYSRTFDRGRADRYLPDQSIGFRLVREPRD